MAYEMKLGGIHAIGSEATITTAAADLKRYVASGRVRVVRVGFVVSTAINGAATLTVYRRPTIGSTTGQVALGTLTIPTATAAGKTLYKDLTPVALKEGEELAFAVTSASATAGAGYCYAQVTDFPEQAGNLSNLVASA